MAEADPIVDAGPDASAVSTSAVTEDSVAPTTSPPAPQDLVDVVATAIAGLMSSIVDPFADSAPTAPVQSPAMWTLLAAARRETFGTVPSVDTAVNPVTNSLVSDAVSTAPVVAAAPTPPLAWLKELPFVGQLVVAPIVEILRDVPIIGDILHLLIGADASASQDIEVGFWAGEERLNDGGQPAPIDGDAYWAPRDLTQFTPELWDVLESHKVPIYFNIRYMRDFGPVPPDQGPYNEILPIFQEANARGVPIWGWVTVPPDEGYFAWEGGAAIQKEALVSAQDWMTANGVTAAGYVLDVEPPAHIITKLREVQGGNILALLEIYQEAIDPAKQSQGWRDYVALVDWAHSQGLKLAATAPNFVLDDNNDGTMGLQDATDVILPHADWDGVFIQAYRNELDLFGDPGPGIVNSYFTSARHQYGGIADVSIGTPGETGYLDAASMVNDIRLLATLGGHHVPVYTLERTAKQFGAAGVEQIVTQVAPYTGWEAVAAKASVLSPLVFLQRAVFKLMDVLATVMTPFTTLSRGNPQLPNRVCCSVNQP